MKNRTKFKGFTRILSLCAALCASLSCLSACSGNKAGVSVDAETVVGTVDGREICYDELYFLMSGYAESVKAEHGDDAAAVQAELDRLARENIISNTAVLRLCEDRGLTYKESDWKDEIDAELDAVVEESFDGDKDAYLASMAEYGLTERYLRYTTGLDLLYNELLTLYPEQGLVSNDEKDVIAYINEHFIHVYHLAIFNDSGDDKAANLAKITEARELLSSGQASMYELIKRGYTEDFSDPSGNGYYIAGGTMDPAYEEAAFALKVGEVSEVVASKGENNLGEYVDCYYLIQRVEPDEDYINTRYYELQNEYYGSVIAEDLEEVKATLSFVPNDYYLSLELASLLPPAERSTTLVIVLWVGGGALLVAVCATVTILLLKRKHRKKNVGYLEQSNGKAKKVEAPGRNR